MHFNHLKRLVKIASQIRKMLKCFKAFWFILWFPVAPFSVVLSENNVTSAPNVTEKHRGEMGLEYYLKNSRNADEDEELVVERLGNGSSVVVHRVLQKGLMKSKCPQYKSGENPEWAKMADVWQAVYYKLPEDIACFKIHIKRTTEKERKSYLEKYGSFDNTVDWNKCYLEVKGSRLSDLGRKHFLMGDTGKRGVLENIIILENRVGSNPLSNVTYSRTNESPDQWRVMKNLLLMRDCDEGYIVIFSRYPHQPRRADIYDALMEYGEHTMDGKLACAKADTVSFGLLQS